MYFKYPPFCVGKLPYSKPQHKQVRWLISKKGNFYRPRPWNMPSTKSTTLEIAKSCSLNAEPHLDIKIWWSISAASQSCNESECPWLWISPTLSNVPISPLELQGATQK